jgi:hypothetical protein
VSEWAHVHDPADDHGPGRRHVRALLASQVGLEVLARGGNAIDAGVATAFALTLVKPQECGIGGECPILIYQPGREDRAGQPNPYVIRRAGPGAAQPHDRARP